MAQAALDEMHEAGFKPEFGPGVDQQTAAIDKTLAQLTPTPGVEDLRGLGWSSIETTRRRTWTRLRWRIA